MKLPFSLSLLALSSQVLSSQIPFQDTPTAEAFTIHTSEHSPHHSIRIKEQQSSKLCDAHSKQYTGWLDVGSKHLFFWYFESQSSPSTDPLVLWLTGGPGGSSMIGLFQENGPCLINEHGNGTTYNEYGWSKSANLLYVDQPAGVGFSYLDEGIPVPGNSFTAAEDMAIFLQMFIAGVFPQLLEREVHVTGESYAGHYVPTLGARILTQNTLYPLRPQINLHSIFVGNAYISPAHTHFGYWETLCTTNPGVHAPVFNTTLCDTIAANLPRCIDLATICYAHPDPALCAAAEAVCWAGVIVHYDGEAGAGGRNRFNIDGPCVTRDDWCYEEIARIDAYLNLEWVFDALQVPAGVNYTLYSRAVSRAFGLSNDEGISTEPQVRFLLEAGVDVLFYQGALDLACNTAGNWRWAEEMRWKGQMAFVAQEKRRWGAGEAGAKGDENAEASIGWFKEVKTKTGGGGETTFAFATVEGAGHLVPYDKPREALRMVEKWLGGRSFA